MCHNPPPPHTHLVLVLPGLDCYCSGTKHEQDGFVVKAKKTFFVACCMLLFSTCYGKANKLFFLKLFAKLFALFGCQKVSKSHPKPVLWIFPALWGDLGRPLGRLWVALGASWVPKSHLWASFGRPVGSFGRPGGPFWLPLGCFWWRLGCFLEGRGFIWGLQRPKSLLFGIMRFTYVKPYIS